MEYREIQALNQSSLKKILISPKAYKDAVSKQEESTEDHFVFGTMVDLLLTDTKENFDKKFYVVPANLNCTDTVQNVVKEVFEEVDGEFIATLEGYRNEILKHCKYQNYYSNWKDDTRVDKIIEQGKGYFEILKQAKGKITVSDVEYAQAVNCVAALKTDQFSIKYVRKLHSDVEFKDKLVIQFKFKELDFKGELDRVVIDHKTKTITPIDFKTTSKSINSFSSDFWYYRYDFQAAVYRFGLPQHPEIGVLIHKGYTIENFLYIVVEKFLNNLPMVFEISDNIIHIGYNGGELSNGKKLEGFSQAIERYKFAQENDAWDYPMEYYKNKGKISIEL